MSKLKEVLSEKDFNKINLNTQEITSETTILYSMLPFFKTVRDITRYINALFLKYSFFTSEMNIGGFLGILTLQVFNSKTYEMIFQNSELFTIHQTFQEEEFIKIYSPFWGESKETKKLISTLFLKTDFLSSLQNHPFNDIGRISNPASFGRYFTLSTKNRFSTAQANKIIDT